MKNYNLSILKQKLSNLKDKYESLGSISWDTFNDDQEINKEKTVILTNNDFKNGTLRIHQPCLLKLSENISFNPNRPTTWLNENNNVVNDFNLAKKIDPNRTLDWFPDSNAENNSQYFEPEVAFAYGLGFFAAIAIEASNIILDLNGYKIEQHLEHSIQQRFYAHIELADQPFIPFQGPSNFGSVLRSAHNTLIINGKLGLSSHHGIHGNGNYNILIENVEFEDFEVAAIALNGGKNVYCENVTVNKNNQNIALLGTYSAGRFIKNFVQYLQTNNISSNDLDTAFDLLKEDLDKTFNSIIFSDGNIPDLYKNNEKLIDGSCYGILFNSKGVAVNSFQSGMNKKQNETTNICLRNCSINNIKGKINEIVAIGNGNGAAQIDTAGAVIQFFDGISNKIDNKYYYQGTLLSDVQIELAKIKTNREENNQSVNFFGTLNITKGLQVWKDDADTYFVPIDNKLKLYKNDNPHLVDSQEVTYEILCNGDSMFHVNKGVMGLRIDGVNNFIIENCAVTNIDNIGNRGSSLAGNYVKSHPNQDKIIGYGGSQTFGIVVNASNDINIKNLNIKNISSKENSAHGLTIQNESCNFYAENIYIDNINSSVDNLDEIENYVLPNNVPISKGIVISKNSNNVNIKNINILNVNNHEDNPYPSLPYEINSKVNIL